MSTETFPGLADTSSDKALEIATFLKENPICPLDGSSLGVIWFNDWKQISCPEHGKLVYTDIYGINKILPGIELAVSKQKQIPKAIPQPISLTPIQRDIKLIAEYLDKHQKCPICNEIVSISPSAIGGEYSCRKHGIIFTTVYQPWRDSETPLINQEVGKAILGYEPISITSMLLEYTVTSINDKLFIACNKKTDKLINDTLDKLSTTKQCPLCNKTLVIQKKPGILAETIVICPSHGVLLKRIDYRPGVINKQVFDMAVKGLIKPPIPVVPPTKTPTEPILPTPAVTPPTTTVKAPTGQIPTNLIIGSVIAGVAIIWALRR